MLPALTNTPRSATMKHAGFVAIIAALVAVPAVAQQPAPRDTSRHGMMGHQMSGQQMPAAGTGQSAAPMGQHQMPGMSGMSGMQGGMAGCTMMGGDSAGGMMAGMMAAMATAPEHLLAQKAVLRLSADQERQLTALRDAARPAHDAALRDAQGHARELAEVFGASRPDTAAVRAHFQGAATAMEQAHLAMLTAAARARAVLTDAQRRQIDSLHAGMGMGGGGMTMPHDQRN
jgi:Spy/CpxP family protein refolding chaperone